MDPRSVILLYAFGDDHDAVAGKLLVMGYRPLRATAVDAAAELLGRHSKASDPVNVMLMPSDAPFGERASELAKLGKAAGPRGIVVVVCGKRPGLGELEALRHDGVRHGLWEPYNDGELRFVINRALHDDRQPDGREDTRVPTDLMARVRSGTGEKPALVYNLSRGGVYLETHRPSMQGAHVEVVLPLPGGNIVVGGHVVSANVPGNLQRHNLPKGMGVAFEQPPAEVVARIEEYVAKRMRSYDL